MNQNETFGNIKDYNNFFFNLMYQNETKNKLNEPKVILNHIF